MKYITINTTLIFLILFSYCCIFNTSVYADSTKTAYYISSNRSPRFSLKLTNKKKVTINITDNDGISSIKVEKYSSTWKDITSKVTTNKAKTTLTISSDLISKKGTKLRITLYDKSSLKNYTKDVIVLTKLSKANSSKNYFSANLAPRISVLSIPSYEKSNVDSVALKLKDGNAIKSCTIKDLNNDNKTFKQSVSSDQTTCYTQISLKNLKTKDSRYNVLITVIDKSGNTHIEKLMFYIKTNKTYSATTDDPTYIAHRGASSKAIENTATAFEIAANLGVYGVETDIWETADNNLVCFHDSNLSRMTNNVDERKITDLTLEELQNVELYSSEADVTDKTIPTFEQYLDICKDKSCAIIELKTKNEEAILKVLNLIKEKNMENQCIIITFTYDSLSFIRENNTAIKLGYLINAKEETENLHSRVNQTKKLGNAMISIAKVHATTDLINYSHTKGIEVGVWTVDSYADKSIMHDIGVDTITTNKID